MHFIADCRATAHPECKEQVPLPCIPSTATPGTTGKLQVHQSFGFYEHKYKERECRTTCICFELVKKVGCRTCKCKYHTPPVNPPCVLSTYLRDKCDTVLGVGKKSVCTFMMDFAFFAGLPFWLCTKWSSYDSSSCGKYQLVTLTLFQCETENWIGWIDQNTGWRRHRENREFSSYFFQTGKTQGILFWHREKFANTGKIFGLWLLT